MSTPTSFKVMLGEQRPFGNPQFELAQGITELEAFLGHLRPACVQKRAEESVAFLITIGAGLGLFKRPKDATRPIIVGVACASEEWSRVQHAVEKLLQTLPENVFLILYCVGGALDKIPQATLEVVHGQCRIVRSEDLRGERAIALRSEIRVWRRSLIY